MKKTMKIFSVVLLTVALVTSGFAMADENAFGAAGASIDENYTLEEMLTYAIQDEYIAKAEYEAIIGEYGTIRPFTNIIKAEQTHIDLLTPLFETYGFVLPINDASTRTVLPDTLEDTYTTGVEAEIKNIEMYKSFLEEDLPEDVQSVFVKLMNASEKHLKAFENKVDSTTRYTTNNGIANSLNDKLQGNGNRFLNRNIRGNNYKNQSSTNGFNGWMGMNQ